MCTSRRILNAQTGYGTKNTSKSVSGMESVEIESYHYFVAREPMFNSRYFYLVAGILNRSLIDLFIENFNNSHGNNQL